MTDLERWLAQERNSDIRRQVEDKTITIEVGTERWPEGWYSDPFVNVSFPLVASLVWHNPGIKHFRVFYEPDFQHVEFDFDGDTYDVRWYKIFVLSRKSDGRSISFGLRDHAIGPFFASGKHRTSPDWH